MSNYSNFQVTLESRQIVFKSVGFLGKLFLHPPKDLMGRVVGVYSPTEEEKKRLNYYVEPNTVVVIEPGTILNLADMRDATNWQWIKESKGIALSREEAMSDPSVYFYVFDEEAEYQKELRKDELQAKAMQLVMNTPEALLGEKARLLGYKMETNALAIRKFLYAQAKSDNIANVKALIDVYEDKDADYKLTLMEFVDRGVVKQISGIYLYDDIPLGMNVDQCVFFLKDPNNKELVDQMIRKSNPGSSLLAKDRRSAEQEEDKKVRKKD